jgi:uncharacterized radical SAM superfamily protein
LKDVQEKMETLLTLPFESLLERAWKTRMENFPPQLNFSVPSAKTYITEHYKNKKNRFVNVSITGRMCELNCEHCKGKLLESMIPANSPDELKEIGDKLMDKDCQGILISGGAISDGTVPLNDYFDAIHYLRQRGLNVIVHTGLVKEDTAIKLKEADVNQVLIDIIGDEETIRKVYHLDKTPKDFAESMRILKNVGLQIAPHIVIGLHFGEILGEYNALGLISEVEPEAIVLVMLSPMYGTPMKGVKTPAPKTVAKIAAVARIVNPKTKITFGCARPPGSEKIETEKMLIKAGINSIAYPTDEAVDFAQSLGLKTNFREECCSLL